jgi:hypothetical protein
LAGGGPGREGEAGDHDGGDEAAGEGLEDAGDREAPGAPSRQRGGDLGGDRGDEDGPGDPHHHRQRVDEGASRDPVAVERVADLCCGGDVVREGPADVVPQRPGDAGHEGGEEDERPEPFGEVFEPGHVRVLALPWRCQLR